MISCRCFFRASGILYHLPDGSEGVVQGLGGVLCDEGGCHHH